jgi:hypothetical protein
VDRRVGRCFGIWVFWSFGGACWFLVVFGNLLSVRERASASGVNLSSTELRKGILPARTDVSFVPGTRNEDFLCFRINYEIHIWTRISI